MRKLRERLKRRSCIVEASRAAGKASQLVKTVSETSGKRVGDRNRPQDRGEREEAAQNDQCAKADDQAGAQGQIGNEIVGPDLFTASGQWNSGAAL
jgi:hypothetical protein